ncbi:MAG TPA: tail fiber protein [Acetobacteraceae bacterium]|nr:tail fiber protein [Acetobacteraceae bacterium]
MSTPYLSQIEAFAFGFAPKGWAQCAGQLLPIQQNAALFSLLGTTYGGDGIRTFALPDLRSRFAVGMGQGAGLSNYVQGEQTGTENVTIMMPTMPAGPHTHSIMTNPGTTGGTNVPGGTVVLSSSYKSNGTKFNIYDTTAPSVTMGSLTPVGGQPHGNIMPYLAVNYCIALVGIFPTRG